MLYTQNGDCIVAIDSVTSRHPLYSVTLELVESPFVVVVVVVAHALPRFLLRPREGVVVPG